MEMAITKEDFGGEGMHYKNTFGSYHRPDLLETLIYFVATPPHKYGSEVIQLLAYEDILARKTRRMPHKVKQKNPHSDWTPAD